MTRVWRSVAAAGVTFERVRLGSVEQKGFDMAPKNTKSRFVWVSTDHTIAADTLEEALEDSEEGQVVFEVVRAWKVGLPPKVVPKATEVKLDELE